MKILNNEGKELTTNFDLGIVEAGKSKEYSYYIVNDTVAELVDVKVEIAHKEVEIVTFPSKLKAGERGELTIKWSPSLTVKKGLQTLVKITGSELWR